MRQQDAKRLEGAAKTESKRLAQLEAQVTSLQQENNELRADQGTPSLRVAMADFTCSVIPAIFLGGRGMISFFLAPHSHVSQKAL